MTEAEKLRLCPLCDHEPEAVQSLAHSGVWYVVCKYCEEHGVIVQGRLCRSKDEAVLWWNSHCNSAFPCRYEFTRQGLAGAYEQYAKCSRCGIEVNVKSVHKYCAYCGSKVIKDV